MQSFWASVRGIVSCFSSSPFFETEVLKAVQFAAGGNGFLLEGI